MRSILVAILLVAVTPAGVARAQPAPGGADAQAEVDALIADGTRLADAGDYRRALARFDAAFARAPRATIMLKRGVVLARLERRLEAAAAFEAYLGSGSADPRLVGTVEAQLARLDAALAHLTIAVDDATPVEVQLGDGPWIVLPRGPVRVAPGSYRIAVRATDRRAEVVVAAGTIAAGEARTVDIVLPIPPDRSPTAARPATSGRHRVVAYGALGLGAAAILGGAVVLFVVDEAPVTRPTMDPTYTEATVPGAITLGVGVALVGLGSYLLWHAPRRSPRVAPAVTLRSGDAIVGMIGVF